jgi:chaperonin GroEL
MTLIYGSNARKKLLAGAEVLAKTVAVTLGPKGRNVTIQKTIGDPLVTKDGVSVAKEIELEDHWENMGAQLVKEAASKTSEDAGDGTTTSTVLAGYMFGEGLRLVEAGLGSVAIKRGMDKCFALVDEVLGGMAVEVSKQEDIENVATISANGDRKLGRVIADAVAKVGRDGVVNIEEGKGLGVESEVVDGLVLDKGWSNPEFANEPDACILDNPLVLVTDMALNAPEPMIPVIEAAVEQGRPVVFVSPEYGPTFVQTLIRNKEVLKSCCVRAPGFGHTQYEVLEDLAILLGATFVTRKQGMTFECFKDQDLDSPLDLLGSCSRIKVTMRDATFTEGAGTEEAVDDRIQQINGMIARTGSEYDADKLRDRLGKLLGGICSIKVGAASELEIKEVKGRLEDALFATKASVESGILPGGGMALIRASQQVQESVEVHQEEGYSSSLYPVDEEESQGFNLVLQACQEPLRVMLTNGRQPAEVWLQKVLAQNPYQDGEEWYMGVNVATMEMVNMLEAGILDPAKVVRRALANAVSVVGTMLTAEVLVHKN